MKDRINILLIEDNPGDAFLTQEFLEEIVLKRAINTFHVSDLESVRFIEQQNIDVIFLDLGLPDSQGISTYHKIKESFPDKTIFVLTGNDNPNILEEITQDNKQILINKSDLNSGKLQILLANI